VGSEEPDLISFRLEYFDDDASQEAHVLAFLHLLLVMQEALANSFSN
jgi:hypothetical protein